ncbi:MAG: Mitomycin biosynthesis 6-O-methyltransferase [Chlamydiae bacterium]|nr:Mitomycin biosynthesis 6-O-methyltransferase [Chlamydiota bacterium]
MKKSKANLLKKIHGGQVCQIVATTARLGLPDLLKEQPKSLDVLSNELKIEESILARLISALVALHLLEEENGVYCLTEEGRHLISDHEDSIHAIAVYKGSPFLWAAHGMMCEGINNGVSPFELAYGQDLFSHLDQNSEHCAMFQNAMACYEKQSSKKILDLYDFEQLNNFLDVGGGLGNFALTIMDKYPAVSGAVMDLPSVIKLVQDERLALFPGNFFETIPSGFDAYVLRNILHDWSDEKCLLILKNLRKACDENSRLLIFETFYEKTHGTRLGKFSDLTMFTLTPGGKERTKDEIAELLEESGFTVTSTYQTTSSKSLVEANVKKLNYSTLET